MEIALIISKMISDTITTITNSEEKKIQIKTDAETKQKKIETKSNEKIVALVVTGAVAIAGIIANNSHSTAISK